MYIKGNLMVALCSILLLLSRTNSFLVLALRSVMHFQDIYALCVAQEARYCKPDQPCIGSIFCS